MSRLSSVVYAMTIVGFTSAASGCSSGTTSAPVPHYNDSRIHSSPQSLGSWSIEAQSPTKRAGLAGAVVNGIFYAMGGGSGIHVEDVLDTVEAYDHHTNTWSSENPMPTARTELAAGVVGGKIYAVGGATAPAGSCCVPVANLEVYNPATGFWTTRNSMPSARSDLAVGVANGILYAVGGLNMNPLNTVEAYNAVTDTWTTKAPMPTARWGLTVSVVNGELYAMGGLNSSGVLNTVEAYDPATDHWTTKTPMPTARWELGSGVINGRIYAVGGLNDAYSSTVEAYDPATNSWKAKASMANARASFALGVAGKKLYLADGCCKGNLRRNVRTLWAFIP